MTEAIHPSVQSEDKKAELISLMADILPGTRGHFALKDMLFVEVSRLGHDRGRRPSEKYQIRLGQIQNRRSVPDYAAVYDRLNELHQALGSLEQDPRIGNKNALRKVMEEAIRFSLIPSSSTALLGE